MFLGGHQPRIPRVDHHDVGNADDRDGFALGRDDESVGVTEVFSPDVDEFVMSVTQCSYAEPDGTLLPSNGRRIVVCTRGEVAQVYEPTKLSRQSAMVDLVSALKRAPDQVWRSPRNSSIGPPRR